MGEKILHGAHQPAEKYTSTTSSASNSAVARLRSAHQLPPPRARDALSGASHARAAYRAPARSTSSAPSRSRSGSGDGSGGLAGGFIVKLESSGRARCGVWSSIVAPWPNASRR